LWWPPYERHANRTASVLKWYDMTDTNHRYDRHILWFVSVISSGSNKEDNIKIVKNKKR